MEKQQTRKLSALIASVGLGGCGLVGSLLASGVSAQTRVVNPARDPEQVPTARYGRGESVDLSLIVEEWRDRYPATPIFVCTCNAFACGDTTAWPFRVFTRYQPFVALGDNNAASNEDNGFNCFDMETGDRPR